MFDDNSMNLTSVEAKSASLLSALTTVAELKTNLNQLSQLVQSRNASNCDHDQSVSMQVDQCQEKNCSTSFMETTRNDSVDTFTSIDLETAARSVLNASSEVVRMLQKRRQSLSEAIEDVAVAITESELTRMEALENEMQFRSCDCDGNSSRHNHVLGTDDVSEVSPFNQTAVFEFLERHVNYSVEEMERVSAEFKEQLSALKQENQLLKAKLQHLVDQHVPSQLLPWTTDALERLSQYFSRLEKQCPWLPGFLSKSDSATIPDPESLNKAHETSRKLLTADRDQARAQLTSVLAELSSLRLVSAEQAERIEQLEKQAQQDKSDLIKLKRNVLRYQDYIVRLLDPKDSANAMADILQRMGRAPCTPTDNTSISHTETPVDQIQCFSVHTQPDSSTRLTAELGHPNRIPRSQPSGTSATEQIPVGSSESTNPQSPVGSKISPSTTTSPSVLSRMTTAVSSFAAAIISPRRLQAPPAREPTPVEMQDLPKISRPHQTQFTSREMELAAPHGSISDDSSDFTVTSRDPVPSKFTSGTKPLTSRPRTTMCSPPDWNRFPWRRTGTEPDAVKGSTVEFVPVAGNIGKSAKGSNVEPFAVPILPKNDRAPTLKRKPLGEIPGANKDSHLPALGRTDSAEEKKVPELEN